VICQDRKRKPAGATHFLSSAEGCRAKEIRRARDNHQVSSAEDKLRTYISVATTSRGGLISTRHSSCSICVSSYGGDKSEAMPWASLTLNWNRKSTSSFCCCCRVCTVRSGTFEEDDGISLRSVAMVSARSQPGWG
jgi:hypothetical protein